MWSSEEGSQGGGRLIGEDIGTKQLQNLLAGAEQERFGSRRKPSCLQPCELVGLAQAAEDTGVCWWIWWKEPWHQSEHHRMAGMGPLGQEMREWLQVLSLNRGKSTSSQHRGRSSTSTLLCFMGDMREDGDSPGAHCIHPHISFREGGAQSKGAEHITQQSFPKLCPFWGPPPSTPR